MMTIGVLFILSLFIVLSNKRRLRRLRERALHDHLLYSLCEIRDRTAMLAVRGELSEDSASFRLFYLGAAAMVHDNKANGPCFCKLIRVVDESSARDIRENMPNHLASEIENGGEELTEIAKMFAKTFGKIIRHAYPSHFIRFSRIRPRAKEETRVREIYQAVEDSVPHNPATVAFA